MHNDPSRNPVNMSVVEWVGEGNSHNGCETYRREGGGGLGVDITNSLR